MPPSDEAGAQVPEPWEDLGVELLVDQPGVRCWIEVVPPGEQRPAHTHRHPWVTVVLSGARGESFTPEGELIKAGELTTGQIVYNDASRLPFRHYTRNTSDRTLIMVAVELRGS